MKNKKHLKFKRTEAIKGFSKKPMAAETLELKHQAKLPAQEDTQYSYQSHAGKAPKGYTRSDDRICEDVCDALAAHSEIDAREIEVTVKNGVVTLTGSVDSRYIKRLSEDWTDSVAGVKDISNHLEISFSKMNTSKKPELLAAPALPYRQKMNGKNAISSVAKIIS